MVWCLHTFTHPGPGSENWFFQLKKWKTDWKFMMVRHSLFHKLLPGQQLSVMFSVGDGRTSGRCQSEPEIHCGKCFCRSSSSGSWFWEEHYRSVPLNFWIPSSHLPSQCFLPLSRSILLFTDLFPEGALTDEDGGFVVASSDKCFLFTDGLNTVEGVYSTSIHPCFVFILPSTE